MPPRLFHPVYDVREHVSVIEIISSAIETYTLRFLLWTSIPVALIITILGALIATGTKSAISYNINENINLDPSAMDTGIYLLLSALLGFSVQCYMTAMDRHGTIVGNARAVVYFYDYFFQKDKSAKTRRLVQYNIDEMDAEVYPGYLADQAIKSIRTGIESLKDDDLDAALGVIQPYTTMLQERKRLAALGHYRALFKCEYILFELMLLQGGIAKPFISTAGSWEVVAGNNFVSIWVQCVFVLFIIRFFRHSVKIARSAQTLEDAKKPYALATF